MSELTIHYSGVLFGLDKLDEIFRALASLLEYRETGEVKKLIECAKRDLTKGTSQSHPLAASLLSKSASGSYIAGRDAIGDEIATALPPTRRFVHNPYPGPQSEPFMGTAILINEIADGKYMLIIGEGASKGNALEAKIAEGLQLERAIRNVSVSFPLKTHGDKNFRLDLAPYVEALCKLGFTPSEHFSISTLDTQTVTEYFRRQIVNGGRFDLCPEFRLDCGVPGLVVTVGAYGCRFVTHDVFAEPPREVRCEFDGSVITGPIEPKPDYSGGYGRRDSDELENPILSVSVRVDGVKTVEQQNMLQQLPKRIADTVTACLMLHWGIPFLAY